MGQEIKIPVEAKTGGAVKAADELADAFTEVGAAVGAIDAQSRKAAAGLDRVLDRLEEVKRIQEALKRLGISVSEGDAGIVQANWDRMRSQRSSTTAGIRRFDSFSDWVDGHQARYASPREAMKHRRAMIASATQGTEYRRANGPTVDDEGGGGASGGGNAGNGGAWGSGLSRAHSSAMSFGRSMLALAGINSAMGMAGRAVDNASEEAIGTDTLKRRMGDIGIEFDHLRNTVRASGDGLGLTFVELARMGQNFSRTVGDLNYADIGRLGGSLHLAGGLARSYGLNPEEGTQFYGSMAKYGVARDEQSQRRLALLIGDSVARSGYSGKVDELLAAITNYSAIAARQTLTTPNVDAYANALTSLVGKYAGFGPSEAGAMIGQADSAVRRGGAMGEASESFMYSAMRNFSPGLSPLQGMALWQGGLFSTNANTFGQGPLKGLGPSKGNMTTFEKIVRTLRGRGAYKDPLYLASAMSGITGLDLAQSMAMTQMTTSGQLGRSMSMLQSLGIDPSRIAVTGMASIAKIANADHIGLAEAYAGLNGRHDLSAAQRQMLAEGAKGSDEDLRKAMLRIAAGLDQEGTKGSDTRQSIADLNNTLTIMGGQLLPSINTIRDAVVAIAGQQVPGYVDVTQDARGAGQSPYAAKGGAGKSPIARSLMLMSMGDGLTRLQAAGLLGNAWAESRFDPKAAVKDSDGKMHYGMFQLGPERWAPFAKWARARGVDPWTQGAQLSWAVHELHSTEGLAGAKFKMAKNVEQSAAAGVRFERPAGYSTLRENYTGANAWGERLAATTELYGTVDVNIRHLDGKKQTVTVPIKPITAPKPAGTVNYSTDQDYR